VLSQFGEENLESEGGICIHMVLSLCWP